MVLPVFPDSTFYDKKSLPREYNRMVVFNVNDWRDVGYRLLSTEENNHMMEMVIARIKRLPEPERSLELKAVEQLKSYPMGQSLQENLKAYYEFRTNRTRPFDATLVKRFLDYLVGHLSRPVTILSNGVEQMGNTGLPDLSRSKAVLIDKIFDGHRIAQLIREGKVKWTLLPSGVSIIDKITEEPVGHVYPWMVFSRHEDKLRPVFGVDHRELGWATSIAQTLKNLLMMSRKWGGNPWDLWVDGVWYWSDDFRRFDTTAAHMLPEIREILRLTNDPRDWDVIDFALDYVFRGPALCSWLEPKDNYKRYVELVGPRLHGLFSGSELTSLIGTFVNMFVSFVIMYEAGMLDAVDSRHLGDDIMWFAKEPFTVPTNKFKEWGLELKDTQGPESIKEGQFLRMFFWWNDRLGLPGHFFPSVRILDSVVKWERPFYLDVHSIATVKQFSGRVLGKVLNFDMTANVSESYLNYSQYVRKLIANIMYAIGPEVLNATVSIEGLDWWDRERLRPRVIGRKSMDLKSALIGAYPRGP
jgi:hypothetical protein